MKNILKSSVLQYRKNINAAFIPVNGKVPCIKWEHFQNNEQTLIDIEKINWNDKTKGIAILHNEKFIALDFDKCNDENFISKIANELGVNTFIVRTGTGYHIHIELEDVKKLYELIGEKAIYNLLPKENIIIGHLEIRVNKLYTVLPPSLHPSGQE